MHLQVDVWSSNLNREDMLGVYGTFLDRNFHSHAYLLAARPFRPTPTLGSKGSDLAFAYEEDVTKEFGIDLHQHVFSHTTDGAANMQRLCTVLMDRATRLQQLKEKDEEERALLEELQAFMGDKPLWEWCKCHLGHLACVDGTGVSIKESKRVDAPEAAAAAELLGAVLAVVNAINRKDKGKIIFEAAQVDAGRTQVQKLRSVVKQRWASLAILLERILLHFDDIKGTCGRLDVDCGFRDQEEDLREVYSIVKPVASYINLCQSSMVRGPHGRPRAVAAHVALIDLRCRALNVKEPLVLLDPKTGAAAQEEGGDVVKREHDKLSYTARQVRRLLAYGFDKRGLEEQYTSPSYTQRATDLAMFMYPGSASLDYIGLMGKVFETADEDVLEIKADVETRVVNMVALAITRRRRSMAKSKEKGGSGGGGSGARASRAGSSASAPSGGVRKKAKLSQLSASAQGLVSLGLFSIGGADGAEEEEEEQQRQQPEEPDAREVAEGLVEEYKELAAAAIKDKNFIATYPPEGVGEWWRKQKTKFKGERRALLDVAQAVLGQAPSSAPLENAFSAAADIMTRRRAGLDSFRVEMLLVCNIARRIMPLPVDSIPAIPTTEEVNRVLPGRFTREELKTQLQAFSGYARGAGAAAVCDAEEEELSEREELQLLQGWSSLAAWGLEHLDLGEEEPLVQLPPAEGTEAAAAAAGGGM